VPPEMTVVGIPGRVVREERKRAPGDGRIPLEHHLIPDPVADAMAALIDRIDFLETRLAHLQRNLTGAARAEQQRSSKP
jgi:serine O-acetyltransferase